MVEEIRKYLAQVKLIFGLGLIGLFLIMKMVFDSQHLQIGIGYIVPIIGMINIIWAIYDYIYIEKR